MENIMDLARQLGVRIQQQDSFVAVQLAQDAADLDEKLQQLIGEFNLKKMALNREMSAEDKDDTKINALNAEVRAVYAELMGNENMLKYQEARADFDKIVNNVLTIVTKSAEGEDPNTIDPEQKSSCGGGDCSGCSGC